MGAKALTWSAFSLMTGFGVLATVFVVGEATTDPGGWIAVALTASWTVPMLGLSALALRRPAGAERLLTVATGLVALVVVASALTRGHGPVAAVAVLALGVPLAFLGLRRPARAGLLLLVVAGATVAVVVANLAVHGRGPGVAPSTLVVVVPVLVSGLLLRVAGYRVSESPTRADRPASSRATGTRNGEQDT